MYNMNISLFGMKINVTALLFIVIILILIGHTYCGCHNNPYALIEGFGNKHKKEGYKNKNNHKKEGLELPSLPTTIPPSKEKTDPTPPSGAPGSTTPEKPSKTSDVKPKEGFTGLQRSIGEYSPYSLSSNNNPINTSSWNSPNMVVTPGKSYSPEVKAFLIRPKQPVPLPSEEMDLFFNTPFKPECCPNTYSNSNGCACMTGDQYNYLILRGGNNVPYSDY